MAELRVAESIELDADEENPARPFKERCFAICLLLPFFGLLTLWRLLASEACNDDGLDCGASIGAFFGALLLGCPLCLFVIYVSSPEHRYYVPKSDSYPEGKGCPTTLARLYSLLLTVSISAAHLSLLPSNPLIQQRKELPPISLLIHPSALVAADSLAPLSTLDVLHIQLLAPSLWLSCVL